MNSDHKVRIVLLMILILFFTPIISAKQEYAVKESRNCPVCHLRDGPPQLNEIGIYYATNNYSLEGYQATPKTTPTPEPTIEKEIGVHMNTWDVGLMAILTILLMLGVVYFLRL
jgi:hypothetical protein